MNYDKLHNYLNQEFDIILLESEMNEIINIVREMIEPIKEKP